MPASPPRVVPVQDRVSGCTRKDSGRRERPQLLLIPSECSGEWGGGSAPWTLKREGHRRKGEFRSILEAIDEGGRESLACGMSGQGKLLLSSNSF